jgi:ectoine hydroxylase-related dioxygenase (phytanoyl-CoA dioxygenase family)
MNVADTTIPESPAILGRWQIPHLHRYWQRAITVQTGPTPPNDEWDLDNTLLSGLGLNILETSRYLNNNRQSSFEAFEDWIIATNGGAIEESRLNRLRDALAGLPVDSPAGSLDHVPGLTDDELAFFDEHGYVVVHDAVAPADRDAAAAAIYQFLDADPNRPDTWYSNKFGKSIWVPLLRHPAFLNNRNSPRLVKAFAQLWGREDLWSTVDQGGLNPPERDDWKFPGPHVHWDMSLVPPHHFGVHGILYLTDTPADQGAFSCIPGFHRHLAQWLEALPPGEDPRHAVFNHPGLKPITGRAGDLVIWHNSLPHASSPNHGKLPRVVQYITLRPTRWPYTPEWK